MSQFWIYFRKEIEGGRREREQEREGENKKGREKRKKNMTMIRLTSIKGLMCGGQ